MNTEMMIDVETLGTRPGDVVVQIGAVVFHDDGVLAELDLWPSRFEQEEDFGARVLAETLDWWRGRGGVPSAPNGIICVSEAVEKLILLHHKYEVEAVWAWGNMDVPMVEALFVWAEYPVPWHFADVRCARTAWRMKFARDDDVKERRTGDHDGLKDALAQVENLQRVRALIGRP